jgi:hypothetical protein
VTFISAIAIFVIVNILVVAINLPRLDRKKPEENGPGTVATDAEA